MKTKPIKLTVIALSVLFLISCNLISVLQPAAASAANSTPTGTLIPTHSPPILPTTNPSPHPQVGRTRLPPVPTAVISAPATTAPCNRASLVADVSVPPNTIFHSGDPVVKTWRVMNAGSCTWTTAYTLIFDRGYDFISARSVKLAQPVAPGQMADLTLTFPAPDPPGTYESLWNLQGPAGTIFGVGPNGSDPLRIRIIVQAK